MGVYCSPLTIISKLLVFWNTYRREINNCNESPQKESGCVWHSVAKSDTSLGAMHLLGESLWRYNMLERFKTELLDYGRLILLFLFCFELFNICVANVPSVLNSVAQKCLNSSRTIPRYCVIPTQSRVRELLTLRDWKYDKRRVFCLKNWESSGCCDILQKAAFTWSSWPWMTKFL
jgi:hypothetical protein